MTRKVTARRLAAATAVAVVAFAAAFAVLRNLGGGSAVSVAAPPVGAPATGGATTAAAARAVPPAFERLRCSGCHSVAGVGNPGNPLDGIGARRSAAEIRDWTLATGRARAEISAGTARRKAQAAEDPELQALIDWLAASR